MDSLPKRKTNRLTGYDYSRPGCYFVTICAKNRRYLFWDEFDWRVGAACGRPRALSRPWRATTPARVRPAGVVPPLRGKLCEAVPCGGIDLLVGAAALGGPSPVIFYEEEKSA